MSKPKFYQSVLKEVKGDVIAHVYPHLNQNGKVDMTVAERMGSEEAKCPVCHSNHWIILSQESSAVREGGKPYIECMGCGLLTHL